MSTKLGIIAEGSIDHALLPALLSRVAVEKAGFHWPVEAEDAADLFNIRKRGHGGVLEAIRSIVAALDTEHFDHAFFVIVLDRRTRSVQEEVRKLISGRGRFVLGIAIEEVEAWWLGDRTNTRAWLGFSQQLPQGCRYAQIDYQSERDDNPKKTLDELTRLSSEVDCWYGDGSVGLAAEFAEDYWRRYARLSEIANQCPKGFRPFQTELQTRFKAATHKKGKLFD